MLADFHKVIKTLNTIWLRYQNFINKIKLFMRVMLITETNYIIYIKKIIIQT